MRGRMWKLAIYIFLLGFILNLLGIVGHVVVSAFAKRWFSRPLPPAFQSQSVEFVLNESISRTRSGHGDPAVQISTSVPSSGGHGVTTPRPRLGQQQYHRAIIRRLQVCRVRPGGG